MCWNKLSLPIMVTVIAFGGQLSAAEKWVDPWRGKVAAPVTKPTTGWVITDYKPPQLPMATVQPATPRLADLLQQLNKPLVKPQQNACGPGGCGTGNQATDNGRRQRKFFLFRNRS